MIIKTGGIKSGDGARICSYATRQADNERVHIIENNAEELLISDEFAELRGRKNGLLHIIISPSQKLTGDELKITVEAINAEFGFNPKDPMTLAVHESKRADGSLQLHHHYVRTAADTGTGKTYKLYRSKGKDEAISRLIELELGHKLISGPHNSFAEMRLREMGHEDLAGRVAELDGDKPRAAYSSDEHQQAKRKNFDLPALRHELTVIADLPRSDQPLELAKLIYQKELDIADAVEKGRGRSRINLKLGEGIKDHNANRTLKIRPTEVATFIAETQENFHAIRSKIPESRPYSEGSVKPDNQGSGANTSEQPSNDSAAKRITESPSGNSQELTSEATELALAAVDLKQQAQNFADNRSCDFSAADLEAPPSLDDPNLMMKLARMLKKSLQVSIKAAGAALNSGPGMPG